MIAMVDVFKIRLHGSREWERIAARTNAQNYSVVLGDYTIENPEARTDYLVVDGLNGALDFTEANGLQYDMRNVEISLTKKARSHYDFEHFKRKYNGRLVDFNFREDDAYYYTGRLSIADDDYGKLMRTVKLKVYADPFRYPISGKSTADIPRSIKSFKLNANSFADTTNVVPRETDSTTTEYTWTRITSGTYNGCYELELTASGDEDANFVPALAVGISVTPGYIYRIRGAISGGGINERPTVNVYRANAEGKIDYSSTLTVNKNGRSDIPLFFVPEDCNYVFVEFVKTVGGSIIGQVEEYPTAKVDAGDKEQSPCFIPKTFDTEIYSASNGMAKRTVLKARDTWTPDYILMGGANYIGSVPISAPAGAVTGLVMTWDKAVL